MNDKLIAARATAELARKTANTAISAAGITRILAGVETTSDTRLLAYAETYATAHPTTDNVTAMEEAAKVATAAKKAYKAACDAANAAQAEFDVAEKKAIEKARNQGYGTRSAEKWKAED